VKLLKLIWQKSDDETAKGLLPVAPIQEKALFLYYYCHHHLFAKVALTDFAAVIVTVQVPLPEHAPDQPEKVEPLDA
jgi:hypothetical protein